jgi:hypothetical protein
MTSPNPRLVTAAACAALAISLLASTARAQDPASLLPTTQAPPAATSSSIGSSAIAPPAFRVERIVVEGVASAAARGIVIAESRLREGQAYTEAELRDAVYRVKRLPFVVDADMALAKGSERGAYELAITVESVKPIAFSIDLLSAGENPDDFPYERERFQSYGTGTLSARQFVGPRGLLFGSVQRSDDNDFGEIVQVGYTQYGDVRPGAYVSAAVSSQLGERYGSDDFQATLQSGVPLVGNHALRASVARTESKSVVRFPGGGHMEIRDTSSEAALEWIFDSSDDPLVPTDGTRASAGAAYGETRFSRTGNTQPFDVIIDTNIDHWAWHADGKRWWPLTPRQSIAVGGEARHVESRFAFSPADSTQDVALVEGTHATSLWGFAKSRRYGDLRWENSVGVERARDTQRYRGEVRERYTQKRTSLALRSSLLFRNAWGLVRLAISYVDSLGEGP